MKYNNRAINKIAQANRSLWIHVNKRKESGASSTPDKSRSNPRKSCLDHAERLQALTTDHFRGPGKAKYIARFERERQHALEAIWKNYQFFTHQVENEQINEGAEVFATVELSDDLEVEPTSSQWILQHHIVRSNDAGHQNNGTYYRKEMNRKKPISNNVARCMLGAECDLTHETRDEFNRTKPDLVVGGRRVAATGKKYKPANDNQPNPVRDRCATVDKSGETHPWRETWINAGKVRVRYMNGGSDNYITLVNEPSESRPAPKRPTNTDEHGAMDELLSRAEASNEIRKEKESSLSGAARTYLQMDDVTFRRRINEFAKHGEAIIAEEEAKLAKLTNNNQE